MNADVMFSSATSEWATPQDLFDSLNAEFHFTLDPCSTDENAKCEKHYTKEQDGLKQDWTGERVFCNPPYGREMSKWIEKCYKHFAGGGYGGDVDSGANRHQSVSQVHLRRGRNPLYQRQAEIRRFERQRAVSVNDRCF